MNRRPKMVLHVLNGASGGAVMSTLGLIEMLEKQGVQSSAVCHPAGTDSERQRLSEAVHGRVTFTPLYWMNRKIRHPLHLRPFAEARQLARTAFAMRSTWKVVRAARRWDVDLIHTNTSVTPEGGMAARMLELPHVWHVREMIGPGKPFRFWLEGTNYGRFVRRYASRLVCNSNATAAAIADWLPPGLLAIVPNGIDISQFAAVERPKREGSKIVVAMVAGLQARWKKHDVFVKAALAVDPQLPVEFRIYGHDPSDGGKKSVNPYIDGLHEMIESAGARARFAWPGYVADPRQVMSEIDILAHSADHESFGRVIVEGMAAMLPVVGVNGGGVGEIVLHEKTGLLVPPDDHVAMARAIETLVRDPARREAMGRAGHERAFTTYSLEACARGVLEVYETAMERPLSRAFHRSPVH